MSVTKEHLEQLQDRHDLWAEKYIDYVKRGERLAKSVGQSIEGTKSGVESSQERRARLREQLRELEGLAERFGRVAPSVDHDAVKRQLAVVGGHVDKLEWDLAEAAITQARRLIDLGAEKLDDFLRLRLRTINLFGKLESLRGKGCGDEFALVWQSVETLEAGLSPQNVAGSTLAANQADDALALLEQHIGQERQRIRDWQQRREAAKLAIDQLVLRAQDAGADKPLLEAMAQGSKKLGDLAASRDEGALKIEVEAAETALARDWTPAVEVLEEALAKRARLERVAQLRKDLPLLLQMHAQARSEALASFDAYPKRLQRELEQLIAVEDADDADAAELLYLELKGALEFQAEQMRDVRDQQDLLKDTLADYQELAKQDHAKDKFWSKLESEFEGLPEGFADPDSSGWATLPQWAPGEGVEAVEDFARELLIYRAKTKSSDAKGALTRARKGRDKQRERLDKHKRFATAEQRKAATEKFDELTSLLDGKDQQSLEPDEAEEAQELIDALETLNTEIADAHSEGRKKSAQQDKADKGHSVARHGPEVSDEKLQERLSTGYGPDKVLSPTKKSTRFTSYGEWEATRKKAFEDLQALWGSFGDNLDIKPAAALNSKTLTIDHGRVIGEGFKGKGAATVHNHPTRGGETYQTWDEFEDLPGLTKTKTTIEWNGKRWVAAQHFPVEK